MLDTLGMFDAAMALPEQVVRAAEAGAEVTNLPPAEGISSVVVLGMGGSGIGGDVLRRGGRAHLPGPGGRVQALRVPRLRRSGHVGVRRVVLGQHGGDGGRGQPGLR